MRLVQQWERIERELPPGWTEARLALRVDGRSRLDRAAALLGPLTPGRRGDELRFSTLRGGAGPGPDHLRRLLRRLDDEGVAGELRLLAARDPAEAAPAPAAAPGRPTLAESWDALLATLPRDWSDLYCQLELSSTDHLERAALLLAPVNPARFDETPAFRFRVARRFGYGASPEITRRCLARLDEEGIPGRLELLMALSDTRPVATQGPVWRVGGKSV